jgi:predicted secreted protein
MAKFNGTDLLVYVGTVAIAHSTSATLNIEQDLPDATTKGSGGFADHINGLKNWSIDFDGLVDYAASYGVEELFDNLKNGNNVTVKFSTSTNGDSLWTGTASVSSLTMTAEMEAPVSFSGTFVGKGTLTKSTV